MTYLAALFYQKLSPANTISLYQPILQSIAYNFVRCKQDAEDIVQDTFLKWLSVDHTKIQNTKAYLIASVTNNCLNHLNSLKRKKEEYWDNSKLSQVIIKFKESDFGHLDLQMELSAAFKVLHTKLEPLEKAAFLLREVFDFDYDSIQKTLDKKADHCRQLLSRAKKKLDEETSKIHFELPKTDNLMESFKNACHFGEVTTFINDLKRDISTKMPA
jgi:RNA polymerase sigma factor (sigma-70 family)